MRKWNIFDKVERNIFMRRYISYEVFFLGEGKYLTRRREISYEEVRDI